MRRAVRAFVAGIALTSSALAQEPPRIRAGAMAAGLHVDGVLDEPMWSAAEPIDQFTQTDPNEGQPATARTSVRIIASATAIAIGVVCDQDPADIVSFSVRRDAGLNNEDHVRIVLGPFLDGSIRVCVYAINPTGALRRLA